jgi:hypothetical protein
VAEQAEQVEQFARKLWENRSSNFIERIEKECGYPKNTLDSGPWGLEWDQLPDKAKDHLREMAAQEVAAMQTPPSEVEQYLITMFRELERLRPVKYGATSHGIAWDNDWERLVLLVVLGDAAYLHPLYPGDLTRDPIATAANLWAKAEPEIDKPDANYVGYKR